MAAGAPAPSGRPDVFAWAVCVLLSGSGYAVAVGCLWALGTRVGLPPAWRVAWLAAFALATVLPAYTRSANNHIAQLGAVAAVCVLLCRIADRAAEGRTAWLSVLGAGLATGFAYNLDFGVGPPLVLAVLAVVAIRTRRALPVLACAVGMAPLVVAGHAINFAIGGDWLKPLNMHPEYLAWPGSPFAATMTGIVRPRPERARPIGPTLGPCPGPTAPPPPPSRGPAWSPAPPATSADGWCPSCSTAATGCG